LIFILSDANPSLFFFSDPATTELYTLSLHDALPISSPRRSALQAEQVLQPQTDELDHVPQLRRNEHGGDDRPEAGEREHEERPRSEEHTSELQSLAYLVCRLLLEKKKKKRRDRLENT